MQLSIRNKLQLAVLVFFSVLLFACLVPKSTSALSGSQFQAGRIIDDSVFYNSSSMSASQIQAFLNAKMPECDSDGSEPYGSTTRAAYGQSVYNSGGAWKGPRAPYTCLKDYRINTSNIAPESGLCNGYTGASNESAATIIYKVAQSCVINPQVLIVLLQKEQSLITDDWPWGIQYTKATGVSCPDNAPPAWAPIDCDPNYTGFFRQMYYGAHRFKVYKANADSYNYRAGRNNTILWHPDTGCGTSNVFIQNQATAALYIYTPYRPNQAALDDLYGSGDLTNPAAPNCSSFGNRNFWRIFSDWFGNTHATKPFAWALDSQEAFMNSGMTQKFSSTVTVRPGEKIYARIRARNWGAYTWGNSFTRLATSRPNGRISVFEDAGWINSGRLTSVTPHAVSPGEVGTFDFTLTAPQKIGTYKEYFNLVAEGHAWFNDLGLYYTINVVEPTNPATTRSRLLPGEQLSPGEKLVSSDKQSVLILQKDGNLVHYRNFKPIWSSGTMGESSNRLVMQGDGNLVLRDTDNNPVWYSATNGNSGSRLELQTDSNLVIYNSSNDPLWSISASHKPNLLAYVNTALPSGGVLYPGQQLQTANRRFRLILQGDGNLVLYSPNRATWQSGTAGKTVTHLGMQPDGNLVLRNGSKAVWHTKTPGQGVSNLYIQADGNVVLRNSSLNAIWHTRTNGKE